MFDRRLIENFDWILLALVTVLSVIGIFAIYSASRGLPNESVYYQRQIAFFLIGLVVLFATAFIDYRIICKWSLPMHVVIILLLILVLVFGTGVSGSNVQRWIKIGPLPKFQPSEFVKYTLVLYLAYYFRDPRRIGNLTLQDVVWPLGVTLLPFYLISQQPDLGTASLLFAVFIPVIFLVGIGYKILLSTVALGIIATPLAWFFMLRPYHRDRIKTAFNPDLDPLGKGYHIIQSKIAVGSGGITGKGFLEGTQAKLNFLPARHTDFIYSVFSEEWGIAGAATVLGLYLILILWCLRYVGKTKDRSGTVLTVGVTGILTAHIVVNVGMVLGMMPVIGMPLPFMSYGGSAIISMMFGIGLILNVRMRRFDIGKG